MGAKPPRILQGLRSYLMSRTNVDCKKVEGGPNIQLHMVCDPNRKGVRGSHGDPAPGSPHGLEVMKPQVNADVDGIPKDLTIYRHSMWSGQGKGVIHFQCGS